MLIFFKKLRYFQLTYPYKPYLTQIILSLDFLTPRQVVLNGHNNQNINVLINNFMTCVESL